MKPDRRTLLKQIGLGAAGVALAQIKVFGTSKKYAQKISESILKNPKCKQYEIRSIFSQS
jgi:hypothetical protein